MNTIKLKRKEGADGYFVNSLGRLETINRSFLDNPDLSVVGLVKENERIWFIRTDEVDGDDQVWVEATFKEVQEYQRTGQKDFLKKDMSL